MTCWWWLVSVSVNYNSDWSVWLYCGHHCTPVCHCHCHTALCAELRGLMSTVLSARPLCEHSHTNTHRDIEKKYLEIFCKNIISTGLLWRCHSVTQCHKDNSSCRSDSPALPELSTRSLTDWVFLATLVTDSCDCGSFPAWAGSWQLTAESWEQAVRTIPYHHLIMLGRD